MGGQNKGLDECKKDKISELQRASGTEGGGGSYFSKN